MSGHGLRFTHLDKELWPPAPGQRRPVTKADYLDYLRRVGPHALPHLRGRPLVLTRYVHGALGPAFYQKNLPPSAPAWLRSFPDPRPTATGRHLRYLLVEEVADLLWVGQQAALEFHPWLSGAGSPEYPDRAVIDLDPTPPAGFPEACAVARLVADILRAHGMRAWLKTSGASGLHLFLPIRPERPHGAVVQDIRALGELLCRLWPQRVTVERSVAARGPRVYVDYGQNARGRTVVGAYSPRPLPGAPVSMPVCWADLAVIRPDDFRLGTTVERLAKRGDAWADLPGAPPQDLMALGQACRASAAQP